MDYMWADTLLAGEQALFLRLLVWSALSILVGTGLIAWLRISAPLSPLLHRFGQSMAMWGLVEALVAIAALSTVATRDLSAATRLDRFLWFNIGLDIGYLLVGAALVALGWQFGRRLGAVGMGLATIVHGSALALLDLSLAAQISR